MSLLLAVGACQGRQPRHQPEAEISIPLLPYFRDLRTVRATVNRDTLTLLFDTGGGATLITPAVAHRLGCQPHGRDVGFRMTGEFVAFQRCDSVTIDLAGWTRRIAPVAVFDVNTLLPAELPRVDGVLALDAFHGQVLTIDWPGRRLLLHAPTTDGATLEVGALPLRAATGESGRMFTVFVRVAGRRGPLWFLIDSGNLRGTLVDSHVLNDSLLIPEPDSLLELQVGGETPYRVAVSSGRFILDGVLGTDFLQRGPVLLDLRGAPPTDRP